jgi:hypothetical protein
VAAPGGSGRKYSPAPFLVQHFEKRRPTLETAGALESENAPKLSRVVFTRNVRRESDGGVDKVRALPATFHLVVTVRVPLYRRNSKV